MGGLKFSISIFLMVLRKNECFGGYEDFVNILGGRHKIGLYLGVLFMYFRFFLKVRVQNGRYIWGLLKFQIFLWGA